MQEQLDGQLAASQGSNAPHWHRVVHGLCRAALCLLLSNLVSLPGALPPLEQGSIFVLLKFHQVPVVQFLWTAALPSNISTGPPSMVLFAKISKSAFCPHLWVTERDVECSRSQHTPLWYPSWYWPLDITWPINHNLWAQPSKVFFPIWLPPSQTVMSQLDTRIL